MQAEWTIQEAGSRFEELVKAAVAGTPQFICENGQEEAVLISTSEWRTMKGEHHKPSFKEMLMSIPKGEPFIDEDSRSELRLRDVEF